MSTALARSLQPASVPHEDAIFNVSRSALLIAALIQSPELLLAATEDKLHQSYRASAMPETDALIQVLRAHGLAAVVSGAGPSILVLGSDPSQRLRAAELVAEHASRRGSALMLAVDFKGATVVRTRTKPRPNPARECIPAGIRQPRSRASSCHPNRRHGDASSPRRSLCPGRKEHPVVTDVTIPRPLVETALH